MELPADSDSTQSLGARTLIRSAREALEAGINFTNVLLAWRRCASNLHASVTCNPPRFIPLHIANIPYCACAYRDKFTEASGSLSVVSCQWEGMGFTGCIVSAAFCIVPDFSSSRIYTSSFLKPRFCRDSTELIYLLLIRSRTAFNLLEVKDNGQRRYH